MVSWYLGLGLILAGLVGVWWAYRELWLRAEVVQVHWLAGMLVIEDDAGPGGEWTTRGS